MFCTSGMVCSQGLGWSWASGCDLRLLEQCVPGVLHFGRSCHGCRWSCTDRTPAQARLSAAHARPCSTLALLTQRTDLVDRSATNHCRTLHARFWFLLPSLNLCLPAIVFMSQGLFRNSVQQKSLGLTSLRTHGSLSTSPALSVLQMQCADMGIAC